MPAKFWVCPADGDHATLLRWTFISPNGRTVVDSADVFESEQEAITSLSWFRVRTPHAPVVAPEGERVPNAFMLHVCPRGYCWEVTGPGGRTVAWSFLPYDTVKAAFKGIETVRRLARDAYLVRPGDARQPTTPPRAVRARPHAQITPMPAERVRQWVRRANAALLPDLDCDVLHRSEGATPCTSSQSTRR